MLSLDPDHEGAHEFLGHRLKRGGWEWVDGKRYLLQEEWDERLADWGHPLTLESEHFRLRTDSGLANAIAVLYDLERMYLTFLSEFGEELAPLEVLDPLDIEVYGDVDRFPRLSSAGHAYFAVGGAGGGAAYGTRSSRAFTYQPAGAKRPVRLFDVAIQHVLYATLLDGPTAGSSSGDVYDRHAAWVEVGFGHWFAIRFGRPAGLRGPPGSRVSTARTPRPRACAPAAGRSRTRRRR